jgi:hypothetical protein
LVSSLTIVRVFNWSAWSIARLLWVYNDQALTGQGRPEGQRPQSGRSAARSPGSGRSSFTDDPWTYGLSVLLIPLNEDSLVRFHPTPKGLAARRC